MRLRRLTARVAEHRDAIAAARLAGWTWTEIGERIGVSGEAARRAHARALAAMQSGKLVPLEQTPLPELPEPIPAPVAPVSPTARPKPFEPAVGADEQRPSRPGWPQIPIDRPFNK